MIEWRQQQIEEFEPLPESLMFLTQDPKNAGNWLGYKGLKVVKHLGAIAGVEDINPHRFRHTLARK